MLSSEWHWEEHFLSRVRRIDSLSFPSSPSPPLPSFSSSPSLSLSLPHPHHPRYRYQIFSVFPVISFPLSLLPGASLSFNLEQLLWGLPCSYRLGLHSLHCSLPWCSLISVSPSSSFLIYLLILLEVKFLSHQIAESFFLPRVYLFDSIAENSTHFKLLFPQDLECATPQMPAWFLDH